MEIGDRIPNFSSAASTGQTLSDESFVGTVPMVMLFVPSVEANTSLLQNFNKRHRDFTSQRVQLLAVSPDTAKQVRAAAEEGKLSFPLVSDPSKAMFRDFGTVDDANTLMDRSVVVDKNGMVAWMSDGASTPDTLLETLDEVRESDRFEMAVNR